MNEIVQVSNWLEPGGRSDHQ